MLGLNLINIEIVVETMSGTFSTYIPFHDGLNIIRAENSRGKSTCVNAIAYALGLDPILGPRRKRPFPKSMYEMIDDKTYNPTSYSVIHSHVSLKIKNSNKKVAVLYREIEGFDDKINVVCSDLNEDYFLGAAGREGSAISERGFHYWLENFLGWNLPTVAKFNGGESKLYLECIFPLFFIEQKRGWSEIQANIPSNWGIKNVKKSAVQFCLNINDFEREKQLSALGNKISGASIEWDNVKTSAKNIADFNSVTINQIAEIKDKEGTFEVQYSVPENNVSVSIAKQEMSLKREIKNLSIKSASELLNDELLHDQLALARSIRRDIEEKESAIEFTILSAAETEKKLDTLKRDYSQYQQLKRLRSVGSDIEADLDTSVCPICDNELFDTLGSNTFKRQPMTLEENIDFLKNQLDFFSAVKNKNIRQLEQFNDESVLLHNRLDIENEKLIELKADLNDVNGVEKNKFRRKIEAENLLNGVLKLQESQNDINERLKEIKNTWSIATEAVKNIRNQPDLGKRQTIVRKLQATIQRHLEAFGFNPSSIKDVTISKQTLRPEQEGYDIVAETSASDYIRIIWAYTLSLLELASKEADIKHGGFVVFDEPRQHETNKVSFASLIKKAASFAGTGGQVIFATSLDESELTDACKDENVNLICFEDYVLTLEKLPESPTKITQ